MRKSKENSIESLAEKATQDSMKMFCRTWTEKANFLTVTQELSTTNAKNNTNTKKVEKMDVTLKRNNKNLSITHTFFHFIY